MVLGEKAAGGRRNARITPLAHRLPGAKLAILQAHWKVVLKLRDAADTCHTPRGYAQQNFLKSLECLSHFEVVRQQYCNTGRLWRQTSTNSSSNSNKSKSSAPRLGKFVHSVSATAVALTLLAGHFPHCFFVST